MKCAVIDDDDIAIHTIQELLLRYMKETNTDVQISVYKSAVELMRNYRKEYNLIFLDIEMEEMDGMQAAEKIREKDDETMLVFITHMAQYAVKGYKVDALDFLVKPVDYYDLALVLRKASRRLQKRKNTFIKIQNKEKTVYLKYQDILYVDVIDHYITYHTKKENIRIRGTIAEAEQRLNQNLFYRCNRCYIVNVSKISAIKHGIITVGTDEIEISRGKQKGLLLAVARYMGDNI